MISEREILRRIRTVESVRRSTELEGGRSTDALRADQADYILGRITAAELGARTRRRYGIDPR
ncbi:antitoxin VbhA family protein [Tsukamurella tyrosinosolvens]|uniref:antitoxin VbhA family protein n=1 Tax=Tsukamurella tyrosinosolvens TaxID=57704 RepID=UPI000792E744|nr:antitoxin VbhA family protein [Tsukamurella tyrosinosolvens]KXO99409.1 hypothetical protein AXK58_24090 [Tsukamurella tyrosinosolvens]